MNILRKTKPVWEGLSEAQKNGVEAYAGGYMKFLDNGKTERECVAEAIRLLEEAGFSEYAPGHGKFYAHRQGKALVAVRSGKRPLSEGARFAVAHADAPRIDLKPYPLYEKDGFAMLKTHYYGGIKKYHWLAQPLELRGVVYLADGSRITFAPQDGDPILFISDLLPHLGADQMDKKASEAFPGENLNVTAGTHPAAGEDKDRVKRAVMELLYGRYGMTEDDFQSAELCLVPCGTARDVGFDRSMIGAYGQDDRACGYAALKALIDAPEPEYTAVCILADKEEIGSEGITGMQSGFFDTVMEEYCAASGTALRTCYKNSFCVSGDVCNAHDPNFPDVDDPLNTAKLGYGAGVFKFTGQRGKAGSSDASAETVRRLRGLLDGAGVAWQMTELGKVDQGGGGTVAKFMAQRNIETIDIGVPLLNMHAPLEVASKADCWEIYRAFAAVYGDK